MKQFNLNLWCVNKDGQKESRRMTVQAFNAGQARSIAEFLALSTLAVVAVIRTTIV